MASVQTTDIPDVAKFMNDFWDMTKEFYIPEESLEYWDALINRVEELSRKYSPAFCRRMCMALVDHLDVESKEMRKKIGGKKNDKDRK